MKVPDWTKFVAPIGVLCGLIGAGYLSIYRLDRLELRMASAETRMAEAESDIASKADAGDIVAIRNSLGAVQLDIALICSDLVRSRGGDPLRECRTHRARVGQ